MSFVDRQGNVVHLSREDYNSRRSANVGEAYAFFDCNSSKEDIESELPLIRELVKTPQRLELLLTDKGVNWDSRFGKELQILSEQSIKAGHERSKMFSAENSLRLFSVLGCRYFIQATYQNGTNRDTANEVASILNQAYQSPLYEANTPFRGAVVYEENGKYVVTSSPP